MTKRKSSTAASRPPKHKPSHLKKWLLIAGGTVLALILIVYISFQVSPRPGALIVRHIFNQGGQKTLKAMEAALPDYPVQVVADQQYRQGDSAAKLDVYIPDSAAASQKTLPVVIWTHGGGWLSGDKTNDTPYFKQLANEGYVVVSLNYALAPGHRYPTPIHELNDAYGYVTANAGRFHVQSDKIVLAGDSAGAQLASQMAAIITNPSYAHEVGITPSLQPSQLAGAVLYCGVYKMEILLEPSPSLPKIIDWGSNTTVWAYTGTRDKGSSLLKQLSAYDHATSAYPPVFISGGNADPLTDTQSKPFASKLSSLGVPVTTLFYPKDHQPQLPHEYQFKFDADFKADGENAFAQMTEFLQTITKQE